MIVTAVPISELRAILRQFAIAKGKSHLNARATRSTVLLAISSAGFCRQTEEYASLAEVAGLAGAHLPGEAPQKRLIQIQFDRVSRMGTPIRDQAFGRQGSGQSIKPGTFTPCLPSDTRSLHASRSAIFRLSNQLRVTQPTNCPRGTVGNKCNSRPGIVARPRRTCGATLLKSKLLTRCGAM